MKKEKLEQKYKKNHKKMLWTVIHQQNGQRTRNGQVSRNTCCGLCYAKSL